MDENPFDELTRQLLLAEDEPIPEYALTQESYLERLKEFVREVYKDNPEGEIHPQWFFVTKSGQTVSLLTPFIAPDHAIEDLKEVVADQIGGLMRQVGVLRYGFISEAWAMKVLPEEFNDDEFRKGMIRDKPGRSEVVQIFVSDSESTIGASFELIRENGEGTPVKELKAWGSDEAGGTMSGRFANLIHAS